MNIQAQKPRRRHEYLASRLALAAGLLVAGCFIGYSMYQQYGRIGQRESERLATQAKVINENLGRQLDGIYLALEGIRKELPSWKGKSGTELANRHLRALADAMPGVRTIMIIDVAGTITICNREQVIGQNVRYREYFQAPFKGRNLSTMYISPPFRTILGNFVINIGLMIPGPGGEFNGVVSAALDSEYFRILLGSVLYSTDMWAALAHGDGRQFLMVPDRQGMAGLDLDQPGSFFTRHRDSGLAENVMAGRVYATGDERMMALHTIKPDSVPMDKPLVVAVGRNTSALYADWRRESFGKGSLFGILALALTSALLFYQHHQRKFEITSARYLEELLRAKETAQEANEAKGRLLTTVAHEFRTPLSLLTSSTDILDRYDERLSRDERIRQHDHIRSAAQQMSGLVDSVLAFNLLDTHIHSHKAVEIDIGQFCLGIAEEARIACCSSHDFSVSIADNCGTARLDKTLLRRVVENLLTNAFRYTPTGGSVSIHVSRENGRLQLVISDSGIGIPEECQKRIFEAFYRCNNVEARRGVGLGLSIVQEALSQLGGAISIDSSAGKGTSMRVEIPIVERLDQKEQLPCTRS
ncbi:MAG: ATP-binding protein [Deltaproteobacteria bacterium]|nr:ATP-binding protein [Deltaproteobacteria bacterium]